MILFFYSAQMAERYEYQAIRNVLRQKYNHEQYQMEPIEALNVHLDNRGISFYIDDRLLDVGRLRKVFLIDLGKITISTLSYRIFALKQFESMGISVVNTPECVLLCRNKLATYFALLKRSLPIVPTVALSRMSLSYSVPFRSPTTLVKPLLGTSGIGIELLPSTTTDRNNFLADYITRYELPLVQPFLEKKGNCDLRLLVAGNQVLSAMRRCIPPGQIATNVARGGVPTPVELSQDIKSLAIQAAECVGGTVVTVDIIMDPTNTPSVLEVNGFARWKGLQKVTSFDIGTALVRVLMEDHVS